MKAAPTLDGRLRIDVESEADALVLMSVIADARQQPEALAEDVGGLMPEEAREDWDEFVLPELRDRFSDQLDRVANAVRTLGEGDSLFIAGDEAEAWFGALNQARLALEARYHFTRDQDADAGAEVRSARIRSHFYQVVQGLILDCLMLK
ncbi:DUF2017 family protein [Haloferula sargassicola]|uniref:Uncharacterized protein n=1 Tax=Haloferula sargassicola TaxID=490096 RepID=A0ABP9UKI3_9BACT